MFGDPAFQQVVKSLLCPSCIQIRDDMQNSHPFVTIYLLYFEL
jgi:hypothetical protein